MAKHKCPNAFAGEGANGGCFFEIRSGGIDGEAILNVGWSCVKVYYETIPITWISELVAIATAHPEGIAGFLKEHDYGQPSYALMCDPEETSS